MNEHRLISRVANPNIIGGLVSVRPARCSGCTWRAKVPYREHGSARDQHAAHLYELVPRRGVP